jgi:hypothetical protein
MIDLDPGIGDAVDLAWKIWAVHSGWAGPALLASYDAERRPVGVRNRTGSTIAARGHARWRAAYDRTAPDPTAFPALVEKLTQLDMTPFGVFGDLAPELPASQLAILPGTTHVGMLDRSEWISAMVTTFLATEAAPRLC